MSDKETEISQEEQTRFPKNKIGLGIAIVFLVILLVVLGFFLWDWIQTNEDLKTQKSAIEKLQRQIGSVKQRQTETGEGTKKAIEEDEEKIEDSAISDWQIYNDEKYDYSLKYPKDWEAFEDKQQAVFLNSVSFDEKGAENDNPITFIVDDITLEERLAQIGELQIEKREQVEMGDLIWTKAIIKEEESPLKSINYFLEKEEKLYEFNSLYVMQEGGSINQRNIDILEKMVESFMFAD